MNNNIIQQLVEYVVFGPGAGALAYKTIEALDVVFDDISNYLAERIPVLGPRSIKRLISYALSFSYAVGFYVLALLLDFEQLPRTAQETASICVTLLGLSSISSGTIHGIQKLDIRKKNK